MSALSVKAASMESSQRPLIAEALMQRHITEESAKGCTEEGTVSSRRCFLPTVRQTSFHLWLNVCMMPLDLDLRRTSASRPY